LNLCLLDVHTYDKDDLKVCKSQLDEIGKILVSEYRAGHPVELNFLTDRILLKQMNNCNAGIEHITVGPDGCFYICPGFYHDTDNAGGENLKAGSLETGITILNKQLFKLDHAPICSMCDAFHCRRCVYLNKLSTLEVNTPSYQQCAVSHLERDTSRIILSELKDIDPFKTIDPIEELDYIDPLLVLTGKVKKDIPAQKPPPAEKGTGRKKKAGEKGFITVRDGNNIVKLPRLKQVIPHLEARGKSGGQVQNKKILEKQAGNKLDTYSVKGLLLEILKTQKQILEILKKESGGQA
jgi:CXXX repeat peptide maturase